MELKDYQARVLGDLAAYLDVLAGMEPYKNTVPGVPHICAKVPTAGGKTFNLETAVDRFPPHATD